MCGIAAQDFARMPMRLYLLAKLWDMNKDVRNEIYIRNGMSIAQQANRFRKLKVYKINQVCSLIALCWYIVGVVWVVGSDTCAVTSPHLYKLSLALTLIFVGFLAINVLCCLTYCAVLVGLRMILRHPDGLAVLTGRNARDIPVNDSGAFEA